MSAEHQTTFDESGEWSAERDPCWLAQKRDDLRTVPTQDRRLPLRCEPCEHCFGPDATVDELDVARVQYVPNQSPRTLHRVGGDGS